jgi:hypothetical protein
MIVEVLRPRNNAMAIEQTVKSVDGVHVVLREPWKEIFTLDESDLSGGHKLHDGDFWTWTVFQPQLYDYVPVARVARVMATIQRNRPAGVLPAQSFAQPAPRHAAYAPASGVIGSMVVVVGGIAMSYPPGVLSDNLWLSDIDPQYPVDINIIWDGTITIKRHASMDLFGGPVTWADSSWGDYSWSSRYTQVDVVTTY